MEFVLDKPSLMRDRAVLAVSAQYALARQRDDAFRS